MVVDIYGGWYSNLCFPNEPVLLIDETIQGKQLIVSHIDFASIQLQHSVCKCLKWLNDSSPKMLVAWILNRNKEAVGHDTIDMCQNLPRSAACQISCQITFWIASTLVSITVTSEHLSHKCFPEQSSLKSSVHGKFSNRTMGFRTSLWYHKPLVGLNQKEAI